MITNSLLPIKLMKKTSTSLKKPFARTYWINDDYSERVTAIQNRITANPDSERPRRDPEEIWHTRLFFVGLFIEAIAIIYYVGFNIRIPTDKFQPNPEGVKEKIFTNLAEQIWGNEAWWALIPIYSLTLISLLIHQIYIKNTFKQINKITLHNWENNPDPYEFPNRLMFSYGEYWLRSMFFFLLAVLMGEIPYLLMVLEKVVKPAMGVDSSNPFMFHFSTFVFIISCCAISLIVLVWDLLLLKALLEKKKAHPTSANWDNKGIEKATVFTWSGVLSFLMWGCIMVFVITKSVAIIFTVLLIFSASYSAMILGYRLWWKKTNPFKGES